MPRRRSRLLIAFEVGCRSWGRIDGRDWTTGHPAAGKMAPRGRTCQPTSKSAGPNVRRPAGATLRTRFFVARRLAAVVHHASAYHDFFHDHRPALDHLLSFRLTPA